jgi:hypothetical protein
MEATANDTEAPVSSNTALRGSEYEEPQGELEQAIALLWKEVFHLDRVGRNDNFFELGGNSLLGMVLSENLTSHLGADVPVLLIFQHPSVRELAEVIGAES